MPIPVFADDDPGPEMDYEPPLAGMAVGARPAHAVLPGDRALRPSDERGSGDPHAAGRARRRGRDPEHARTSKQAARTAPTCTRRSPRSSSPASPRPAWRSSARSAQIQTGPWAPLAGEFDRLYRTLVRQPRRRHLAAQADGRGDPRPRAFPASARTTNGATDHDIRPNARAAPAGSATGRPGPVLGPLSLARTIRDVEAGDLGYLPDLWQEMADLGWLGLTLPRPVRRRRRRFPRPVRPVRGDGRYMVPGSPPRHRRPSRATSSFAWAPRSRSGASSPRSRPGSCIVSVAAYEPSGVFDPMRASPLRRRRGSRSS